MGEKVPVVTTSTLRAASTGPLSLTMRDHLLGGNHHRLAGLNPGVDLFKGLDYLKLGHGLFP